MGEGPGEKPLVMASSQHQYRAPVFSGAAVTWRDLAVASWRRCRWIVWVCVMAGVAC